MFSNVYKNRRVLVTGHTGFKGSWLVAWLQQLGADIAGIALEPDTVPSHFAILKPGIKKYICDIRDYNKLALIIKKIKPEIIFHLAAQPLVRESYLSPLYTLETNIMGTANVLEASKNIPALRAVVVVTSDKCYENREILRGYREGDRLGGYDPYSASKAAAEIVTASYRNSFFNVDKFGKEHHVLIATARAGNVIGGGDWAKDRLIPDIVHSSVAGNVVLLRNSQAVRPWQHVLESLSGYLLLGEKLLQGKKDFAASWNFAPNYADTISVLDIAKKMRNLWPIINFKKQVSGKHLHEAQYLRLNSFKARSLLKWQNTWHIDQALQITTEWYREFYENGRVLTYSHINKYTNDAGYL
jgi:CDP-glucose 4,6-dehydratase